MQCGWGSCVPNREVKPAGRGPKVQGTEQECSREEPEEEPARRGGRWVQAGPSKAQGRRGKEFPTWQFKKESRSSRWKCKYICLLSSTTRSKGGGATEGIDSCSDTPKAFVCPSNSELHGFTELSRHCPLCVSNMMCLCKLCDRTTWRGARLTTSC